MKTAARQRRRRDSSAGSTAAADGPHIGPKHLTWLRRRAPKIAAPTTGRPFSRDSAEPNSLHEPAGPESLSAVPNSLADCEGRNRFVRKRASNGRAGHCPSVRGIGDKPSERAHRSLRREDSSTRRMYLLREMRAMRLPSADLEACADDVT